MSLATQVEPYAYPVVIAPGALADGRVPADMRGDDPSGARLRDLPGRAFGGPGRTHVLLPPPKPVGFGTTEAADSHLPPPPRGSGRGAAIDVLA